MTFEELKEKALSLPPAPGVYIMRDEGGKVIYVGKAKKLKNRVSQYFQDSASHSPKTRAMVGKIRNFDVIAASSEFEALVLECSLIKRYMPRYNILLKDDKGYPYVRLDMTQDYPRLSMVSKLAHDGADYFGPYGSRGVTQGILDALRITFGLPGCAKQFPRDVDKDRPCLNYHMNQCRGWCQSGRSRQEYRAVMEQVKKLLSGNYQRLVGELKQEMLEASENLEFERAAELRDRMKAVETLGTKQLVTAGSLADTDVVGYFQTESKGCFVVLHFSGGNLLDKEYELLPSQDDPQAAMGSLVKQFYLSRGLAPKIVLLLMEMEDGELFSQLMQEQTGRRTRFIVPQRGERVRMVELARENARQEAERITTREEKLMGSLTHLGKLMGLDGPPHRLESFDISNMAGSDIVASMVVFSDGRPSRKDYKRFKVEGLEEQDDYASMEQVVARRFRHYVQKDQGFAQAPDAVLIDGGTTHAQTAKRALDALGLDFPVFGMVKDDRHRTRALVTPQGEELSLEARPGVFALVGSIQEETHRFAITYNRSLRSKRLHKSRLDDIPGVGEKRKLLLLKRFKSVKAITGASLEELQAVVPKNVAQAVYGQLHKEDKP